MKSKFIKCLLIGCLMVIFSNASAFDKNKLKIENSGAYINNFNMDELQEFYDTLEFPDYLTKKINVYPRVFVKNIPSDYALISDKTIRNETFIKILMPIILKVNQEYEEERERF